MTCANRPKNCATLPDHRLGDADEIRRSRQFPYQYLAAYLNASEEMANISDVDVLTDEATECSEMPTSVYLAPRKKRLCSRAECANLRRPVYVLVAIPTVAAISLFGHQLLCRAISSKFRWIYCNKWAVHVFVESSMG